MLSTIYLCPPSTVWTLADSRPPIVTIQQHPWNGFLYIDRFSTCFLIQFIYFVWFCFVLKKNPQGESKVAGPATSQEESCLMMERKKLKCYFTIIFVFIFKLKRKITGCGLKFIIFIFCCCWWTDTLAMAKEMVRPLRRWRIDLLGGRTRKEIFFFHLKLLLLFIWEISIMGPSS